MAQLKTSQYPTTLTVFRDEHLLDVSYWDGISAFTESQKLTWGALKTELDAQLTNNLGKSNQTLTADRTVLQTSFDLRFSTAGNANSLQIDASSGYVGFGIAVPLAQAHVDGYAQFDNSQVTITSINGNSFSDQSLLVKSSTGNVALDVRGNKKVGIGVAAVTDYAMLVGNTSRFSAPAYFGNGSVVGTSDGYISYSAGARFVINALAGRDLQLSASNQSIIFKTNGLDRAYLDSSGNLGVGVVPVAGNRVHINGRLRIDDTTALTKSISTDFLPIDVNGTVRYVALYD